MRKIIRCWVRTNSTFFFTIISNIYLIWPKNWSINISIKYSIFFILFNEKIKAFLSCWKPSILFQDIELYPPNLNPLSVLTKVIVGPFPSHFSWNLYELSLSIEHLYNNLVLNLKKGFIQLKIIFFSSLFSITVEPRKCSFMSLFLSSCFFTKSETIFFKFWFSFFISFNLFLISLFSFS